MNFEIMAEGYGSMLNAEKEDWRIFFLGAADKVGLPQESLKNVFIADDQNWEAALQRLGRRSSSATLSGVTSSKLDENNKVESSLLLPLDVFQEIGGWRKTPPGSRTLKQEFCLYVLFHELGHCFDDLKRRDLRDVIFDPDLGSQ
jgi:hypothetical protein